MASVAKDKSATATTAKRSARGSCLKPQTDAARVTKSKMSEANETTPKSRRSNEDVFGHNLPSPHLRLPEAGNITALEQIVFLTQSLRSHDPMTRLVQNCFDSTTLTFIINQSRTFPEHPLLGNSLCHIVQNMMRKSGHKDWTFKKHKNGKFGVVKRATDDLRLANMTLRCENFPDMVGNRAGVIENIPFEALAVDVTRLPEGDDALDLTRCLIWALHNPGSGLLYPRDFVWLTGQLGGPMPVKTENYDTAVFARWNNTREEHVAAVSKARRAVKKTMKHTEEHGPRIWARRAARAAKLQLYAYLTLPMALATMENGVVVVHTERVPVQTNLGPNTQTVAEYLAPFITVSPVELSYAGQTEVGVGTGSEDLEIEVSKTAVDGENMTAYLNGTLLDQNLTYSDPHQHLNLTPSRFGDGGHFQDSSELLDIFNYHQPLYPWSL
ncbi:hypothetical protein BDU57DRAFT_541653 [Ampelomyces quisqualis]|uniref:Uncharacterized protein n=1 Tax=Ampelomyces quisqualis TaxID=50730 RepID=A0A6A5QDS9_AMPQU|nr:hypothetical protein BDU57DRAFT_541653 [Ampelomyces quisqualis]